VSIPRPQPLWTAKVFYFLYFGAAACLGPFLALYYRDLGFSGGQIGLLAGLSPLVTLIAASFWSVAADATRRHRAVLLGALAGMGGSVALLSVSTAFLAIIPCIILFAFFAAPVLALVDASVIALLGERRDLYGRQRLWGAVGWGVAGPVAGGLVGLYGIRAAFPLYLLVLSLVLTCSWFLKVVKSERSQPFWNGLRSLFADRRWFAFLLVVFLGGTGLSIVTNYLFLYMDEMHAGAGLMGFALSVATLSEIPALYFSGQLLRRWGARGVMILGLAAYVLRAGGYAAATQPWQVVVLQLLHGLTFSLMWAAGVSFAGEMAPRGLEATAQGVFSSTFMGLGGISGALLGGLLLDHFGGAGVFGMSAGIVLTGLLMFVMAGKMMRMASRA